ncbi:hypothetical protein [[Eubacterium] cellulosolvens]
MEESLCHIEISEDGSEIVAKVQSALGGLREFRSNSLEEVLRLITIELQEEFTATLND